MVPHIDKHDRCGVILQHIGAVAVQLRPIPFVSPSAQPLPDDCANSHDRQGHQGGETERTRLKLAPTDEERVV
jgi:hypothetical protein